MIDLEDLMHAVADKYDTRDIVEKLEIEPLELLRRFEDYFLEQIYEFDTSLLESCDTDREDY